MGLESTLHGVSPSDFVRKEFEGVLSTFYPVGEQALDTMAEYFGDAYRRTIFHVARGRVTWFWAREDMQRLRNMFIEACMHDPLHAGRLLNDWRRRSVEFRQQAEHIRSLKLTELSVEDLAAVHDRFYLSYVRQYALAIGVQDAFSMLAEELDIPRLLGDIETQLDDVPPREVLEQLTYPDYVSFTRRFENALLTLEAVVGRDLPLKSTLLDRDDLEVLLRAFDQSPAAEAELQSIEDGFWWIGNSYRRARVLPPSYFVLRLQEQLRLNSDRDPQQILDSRRSLHDLAVGEMQSLAADARIPRRVRVWAEVSRLFTEMQDDRKQNVLVACGLTKLFTVELARRQSQYQWYHLESLIPSEFSLALRGEGPPAELLLARTENVMCVQERGGRHQLIVGVEAEEYLQRLMGEVEEGQTTLSGSAGARGQASGRAYVLRTSDDLAKVPKGAILVASMTRPEHTPAIMVAGGVVTDEGGITSHAVTVCRELGIPCVVGTQSATRLIRSGELVLVDGDSGHVTRCEQP